jgi:NADH-quinone oxidoreductase subunit A
MPTNLGETYVPILLQVLIALAVASAMIGFSYLLGKKVKNKIKDSPYECGMEPTGDARHQFSVKFYLVGMLFILFDVEAIFFYPWVVVFKELNRQQKMFPFFEMVVFVGLILCGFFYIWKMGVLDWSSDADRKS